MCDIYLYCHYSSTQPRLPTGSVIVWTKSRARYVYVSVDVVSRNIYVLQIFVYSTPLACWECACVDEVACPCIYTSMNIVATAYTYCRYWIYICV